MRIVWLSLSLALGSLAVMSCGGSGSGSIASSDFNPGYGPFDKNGNYVEAWADKPAKKHWWARKGTTPASQPSSKPTTPTKKPTSTAIAKNTSSSRAPGSVGTVTRTSSPYRRPATTTVVSSSAPRPTYTPKPTYTPTPKPKPTYTPKPKPKPKPVKPKKPAPIRYLVKKGDTLYGLSRKHGTSVSAIQKANGLKGTTIQIGKTLLIPR